jgi:hypothetical protein
MLDEACLKPTTLAQSIATRDSRNRKVRGRWQRGGKYYVQFRIPGERSVRRVPLERDGRPGFESYRGSRGESQTGDHLARDAYDIVHSSWQTGCYAIGVREA